MAVRRIIRKRTCAKFKIMNTEERGKLVLNSGACTFCLGCSHTTEGCPMKSYWYPCDRNGCGKYHSRLLHGCSTPGLNLHMKLDQQSEMPGMMDSQGSVIILVDVKISNGSIAKIFGIVEALLF